MYDIISHCEKRPKKGVESCRVCAALCKKTVMKKFLKVLGWILLVLVLLVGGLIGFLSLREYRPEPNEEVTVQNAQNTSVFAKKELSVLSFNIGYGGLGDNADFFMDGGKEVSASDAARVQENLKNISTLLQEKKPDFTILQEVDQNSARTKYYDETEVLMQNTGLSGAFALNYSCPFVPYPVPPIGRVNSGLFTLTEYKTASAQRISLPCPFSWPIRTANLKRCLLISRIPIEDSDKELVLVNLHLEAYDGGEGKVAQTKMLLSILEEEYKKGNYVIAGGDFNQTFTGCLEEFPLIDETYWKPAVLEHEELPEGWKFVYDLDTPSCRLLNQPYAPEDPATQHYVLDGFITSPNLEVKSVEALDLGFVSSDHNPVYMEVTLS